MNNMSKKDLILVGVGIVFVIACILSYNFGRNSKIDDLIKNVKRDTVVKIEVDTLTIEKPVEKIRYKDKLVYIPLVDTLLIHDHDTTFIAMQSEKVEYEEEEYKATISGIQPKLESITVYPKTVYETVIEKQIVQKRWSFGVAAGPALVYDFKNKDITGGIGVVAGIEYNF